MWGALYAPEEDTVAVEQLLEVDLLPYGHQRSLLHIFILRPSLNSSRLFPFISSLPSSSVSYVVRRLSILAFHGYLHLRHHLGPNPTQ